MEEETLDEKLKQLQKDYDKKFKAVEEETKKESEDSIGGKMKIDFTFKEEHFAFHVPDITLGKKAIKIDIPEVTMKTKRIVFSVPKMVMKTKKIGERPEVHCKDTWIKTTVLGKTIKTKGAPKCKTVWKPIYTDIPETRMVNKEIKIDLPEIKIATHTLDIPDIKLELKRQDFYMQLPQITVRDVEVEAKEKGEELEKDTEKSILKLQNAYEEEVTNIISEEVNSTFDQQLFQLETEKQKITGIFQPIIDDLKSKIKQVKSAGATEEVKNLESQLTSLVEQFKLATKELDKAIEGLSNERQNALEEIAA